MAHDVFISYAARDKTTADAICATLEARNARCWIAPRDIRPGADWAESITDAIGNGKVMVVVFSRYANDSRQIMREVERAVTEGLIIIPFRIEDVPFSKSLTYFLATCHWLDAFTPPLEKHVNRLAETVMTLLAEGKDEDRYKSYIRSVGNTNLAASAAQPQRLSLLRTGDCSSFDPPLIETLPVVGNSKQTSPSVREVGRIESDFRVDILCYLSNGTLLAGSSSFDKNAIEVAKAKDLISEFVQSSSPTGMDGRYSEHAETNRLIQMGYGDITITHRSESKPGLKLTCESSASVCSADWSPDGSRIVVGSENYLTVWTDRGKQIQHRNYCIPNTPHPVKSVAWQPSVNCLFATQSSVFIADPDGVVLKELKDITCTVICVDVAHCARLFAATGVAGDTVVWNEVGEFLFRFSGIPWGDSWHPSRCLGFSANSRFLAQCSCVGGHGFIIVDLWTGATQTVERDRVAHIAWHPTKTRLLATAAEKTVYFWEVQEALT